MGAKLAIVIGIVYINRAYYYKYAALPKGRSLTLKIVAMELTNLSDEVLVTHYRQEGRDPRDHKLLAELVRRHETLVISACARHVKDRETARDVAQEVWIRVLTKLDQFQPEKGTFEKLAIYHRAQPLPRPPAARQAPPGRRDFAQHRRPAGREDLIPKEWLNPP